MKTIFIINPKSGQGKKTDVFIASVRETISRTNSDAEIYITKSVGDATVYVRDYCEDNGPARFIACGGDGTLSEVLNGAIGTPDAEIGVIPMGSGNDFCRNFDCDFKNIENQINGKTIKCDAIKYSTEYRGAKKEGYCVNMFNIGFDCNVADRMTDIKQKPFISGSFAYFLSILITLIKKECSDLKIELDGVGKHNGKLLLTSVANGSFCGGGIKSNAQACVSDGRIDINIIKNLSRTRFITLLPSYMKGTVMKQKNIEKYIFSGKCEKIILTPNNGDIRISVDGEIISAGKTEFRIVHNAFNFVIPKK
ncbi:MAG: hypothetical protein IJC09_05845 [Clostridia bacterium]|nr:hypothetical protein [Clostridia bacterium]